MREQAYKQGHHFYDQKDFKDESSQNHLGIMGASGLDVMYGVHIQCCISMQAFGHFMVKLDCSFSLAWSILTSKG